MASSADLSELALGIARLKTKADILLQYTLVLCLDTAYGYAITAVREAMEAEVEAGSEGVEEGIEEV